MKISHLFLIIGVLVSVLFLDSCLDNDTDSSTLFPNALVTVKHATDNTVFLQLDNKTTLFPINLKSSPFGTKEVRALVNYEEVKDPSKEYSRAVRVNWIDSIRTKQMAPNLGAKNKEVYGGDPVEIINDWVTIAEDGYLTLRFRTEWGYQRATHNVNLVSTGNPENPYEVEFLHNANGDSGERVGDGLVAFKLDQLPNTNGKPVKLRLKWKSYNGEKSIEFDYNGATSKPTISPIAATRGQIPIQ